MLNEPVYKSIAIDYDTWKILGDWSEEECRSIGGQIRFLVKQHGPKEKPAPQLETQLKITSNSPESPSTEEDTVPFPESSWIQKRCQITRIYNKKTQRNIVIDIFREYSDPLTNKEVLALYSGSLGNWSLESVQKITAAMYSDGLIKRRFSLINNQDRFQYQLAVAAHRLLRHRDKKRVAAE
jgi:hypothetical protein